MTEPDFISLRDKTFADHGYCFYSYCSPETQAQLGYGETAPGAVNWIEIPVLDIPRARKFYSDVFGWFFVLPYPLPDDADPDTGKKIDDSTYLMFHKATLHGAFVKVNKEHLVSPITAGASQPKGHDAKEGHFAIRVSIVVENVDETLENIVKAGGGDWAAKRVLPGGLGTTASFEDSEGNILSLWAK